MKAESKLPLEKPSIEPVIGGYRFSWHDGIFLIVVENMTGNDEIYAEVTAISHLPGQEGLLAWGRVNISSITSRNTLASSLSKRIPGFDWHGALLQAAYIATQNYRRGEDAQALGSHTINERPYWILYPYLQSAGPTIIYARGNSGKSTLALAMALSLVSGRSIVGRPSETGNILYLDWETDIATHNDRLRALCRMFKIDPDALDHKIIYKRMRAALVDIAPMVQRLVIEYKVLAVVMDSLSYAAGDDLSDSTTATRFFLALRNITAHALIVAHTRKQIAGVGKESGDELYGSVYWFNGARNVWLVDPSQIGPGHIDIRLSHQKSNNAPRVKDHGYSLHFVPDADDNLYLIDIKRISVEDHPDFAPKVDLSQRIKHALQDGAKTLEELYELFDLATTREQALLRQNIRRLHQKGELIKLERGMYGLAAR